jgi:hypothetical protein
MGLRERLAGFFYRDSGDAEPAPVDLEKAAGPKAPITEAPGRPGFSAYGGNLQSNESNAERQGTERWRLDGETKRNVSIVGAGLRRYTEFLGAPEWRVPPWDDSPESIERAEFADRQLKNLATPWRTVVQTGGQARLDGAAIQVWAARKLPDGRIGLADVVSRPMHTIERWELDAEGKLLGVWQRAPQDAAEHFLERGRMVFTQDIPLTDSPAGVGIMRHLAEPARELRELRKMLLQGLETDLTGIPVMWAPIERLRAQIGQAKPGGGTYSAADFQSDIAGATNLAGNPIKGKKTALLFDSTPFQGIDGGLTGPRQYDVQLLSSGGRAHAVVAERIRAVMWDLAIILGVEYLLLGADGSGSLAMAQAKTLDFYRLVIGALNGYAEVVQRDVLRPLWALNGWDPETAPRPVFDKLEFLDVVQVMTTALPALATAGVPLDRRDLELVNTMLARLGLPPLQDHEGDLLLDPKRQQMARDLGLDDEDEPGGGTPGVTADEDDGEEG